MSSSYQRASRRQRLAFVQTESSLRFRHIAVRIVDGKVEVVVLAPPMIDINGVEPPIVRLEGYDCSACQRLPSLGLYSGAASLSVARIVTDRH